MQCPRCQHENRAQAKFCEECATPLARTCANCGTQLSATSKFCSECAHPVAEPTASSWRLSSPDAYTPRHLAEKILTSKAALEGERKQVTVLFADLKGSMELLADRDPEEAREILDPVLAHMMEAVHRYEGTVNQVMGDGIMALFGAPLAHEDHAVRACYAALHMQEAIKRYAEDVRRSQGAVVKIRVGLNSGEVVVRAIGGDLHMDYTAVGQTTHLAARMEQLAEPGTAVLTSATLALAEDFVQVRSLGPMRVKGLSEAIEVYELVGANPARSRFHAHAARGLTKFVGRTSEIVQLAEALDLARSGRGQIVAVVGEPGVGKSRLFWEFTRSHRVAGCLILEAGSVSYGKATAYLPVIDLLRSYFRVGDRDDYRNVREKVIGKLLALDRGLEPIVPALLALLDVPPDDGEWDRLDPLQRRQRTREAARRLLLRESREQPVLVVFEDLHWIDGETQALLDQLVESLPGARVLLLVNYRPEYRHGWSGKTYYAHIRIDPLEPGSAKAMLRELLGADPGLGPVMEMLLARTEGNPFFLEESVRTLLETGALVGERGGYRLSRPPDTLQVPATVQAILAARIDRQPPEDRRLLQAAAAIGKDVPWALLMAIAEEPEDRLRHGLEKLQAAEFLYEASLFPDLEYSFKHALTHEVTYASLLHERRRALHARITEAIETTWAARLGDQVERLAHHAMRGELWEKALDYLGQAGAKAFGRSAHREAVACYEQAIEALRHLPETAELRRRAIDLRIALRNSLFPLGELTRINHRLDEAEALAIAIGDRECLALVLSRRTHHFWSVGEPRSGLDAGQRALAIAMELDSLPLKAATSFFLGQLHHARGDYAAAIRILGQVVAWLQGDLALDRLGMSAPPSIFARTWLALSLSETGAFAEALAHGAEALRIAETLDHPYGRYHGHFAVGAVHSLQGDAGPAISALERAVRIGMESSMPALTTPAIGALGNAYSLAGRAAEGIALLALLREHIEEATRQSWNAFLAPVILAQASLLEGRVEEAGRAATRAVELARRHEQRGNEAHALRVLGGISARNASPEAELHYCSALALADELGMRPLVAHCHLGVGNLHRRTGKRQQAEEHLRTAATMYREMDMRFWLEQADAEMRALR